MTARRDDDARISAALEALLPAAEAQGITILLKTSGVFSDTARLRALLDAFACDQLGALWDMHHPYRDHGESAEHDHRQVPRRLRPPRPPARLGRRRQL